VGLSKVETRRRRGALADWRPLIDWGEEGRPG